MANKNHALDEEILRAAMGEFLEKGVEAASMRKIAARAGVTVGAIYTRFPTKDALFCGLVQPLIDRIGAAFTSLRSTYYANTGGVEALAGSMQEESRTILHLLFDDYDRATLLLCRSTGSSLQHFLDGVVEEKIRETEMFFRSMPHPDERVLRLLISSQFHMYFQIFRDGYDLEQAKSMLEAAMAYCTGGWISLLNSGKNG